MDHDRSSLAISEPPVERSGGYRFAWKKRLKHCSIDYLKEELSFVYIHKEINLPRRNRRCRLILMIKGALR